MENPTTPKKVGTMDGTDVAFLTTIAVLSIWFVFVIVTNVRDQQTLSAKTPQLIHKTLPLVQTIIYSAVLVIQAIISSIMFFYTTRRRHLIRAMALLTGLGLFVWAIAQFILINSAPSYGPNSFDDLTKDTIMIGALFSFFLGGAILSSVILSWVSISKATTQSKS